MSGSCVDENTLLMSEVRGEWADWLKMIERKQSGGSVATIYRDILNVTQKCPAIDRF